MPGEGTGAERLMFSASPGAVENSQPGTAVVMATPRISLDAMTTQDHTGVVGPERNSTVTPDPPEFVRVRQNEVTLMDFPGDEATTCVLPDEVTATLTDCNGLTAECPITCPPYDRKTDNQPPWAYFPSDFLCR